jgi:hypothetical protein
MAPATVAAERPASAMAVECRPVARWHTPQSTASTRERFGPSQVQAPLTGGQAFGAVVAAAELEATAHLVKA